jgi:hypothetical protein
LVEEDDVDRVAHTEHMYLPARFDPEPLARLQAPRPKEPAKSRPVRVRQAQSFHDNGARGPIQHARLISNLELVQNDVLLTDIDTIPRVPPVKQERSLGPDITSPIR